MYIYHISLRKNCFVPQSAGLSRHLKVNGCPSKENLFGQFALLINAKYIIFL